MSILSCRHDFFLMHFQIFIDGQIHFVTLLLNNLEMLVLENYIRFKLKIQVIERMELKILSHLDNGISL